MCRAQWFFAELKGVQTDSNQTLGAIQGDFAGGQTQFLNDTFDYKNSTNPVIDLRSLSDFFFRQMVQDFRDHYEKAYQDTLAIKTWLDKYNDEIVDERILDAIDYVTTNLLES